MFIKVDENNKVYQTRQAYGSNADVCLEGEIEVDFAKAGQIMQSDGTFVDDLEEIEKNRIEARKIELIVEMQKANALRDDEAWAKYKAEYDKL